MKQSDCELWWGTENPVKSEHLLQCALAQGSASLLQEPRLFLKQLGGSSLGSHAGSPGLTHPFRKHRLSPAQLRLTAPRRDGQWDFHPGSPHPRSGQTDVSKEARCTIAPVWPQEDESNLVNPLLPREAGQGCVDFGG